MPSSDALVVTPITPGPIADDPIADGPIADDRDAVIEVRGDADAANAPDLRRQLLRLVERASHPRLAVDLSHLDFIDAAGLGALVEVHRQLRRRGGALQLRLPRPSTLRLLELLGLDRVFEVVRGEEAERLVGTRRP